MSINSAGLLPQQAYQFQNNSNISATNIDNKIIEANGSPFLARQTIGFPQPSHSAGVSVGNLSYGIQQSIQGPITIQGPPRATILNTTQSPLIMNSQVKPVGPQAVNRVTSVLPNRQQSIRVFRASGPPVRYLNQGVYQPTQSIVRPVIINPSNPTTQARPTPAVITPPRQVSYREPIQQTIYKQRIDPERERIKSYYQGPGYKPQAKGFPWMKALIGLLALAGLLTGLFFLIRAINQSSNNQTQTRQPVNYKQNATVNETNQTKPLSPIVIDVNDNPSGTLNTNTTTNTTVINKTTIISNTSTTNTSITVNSSSVEPIVVPPTLFNSSTVTGVQPITVPSEITVINSTKNSSSTNTNTTTNISSSTNTTVNTNFNGNTALNTSTSTNRTAGTTTITNMTTSPNTNTNTNRTTGGTTTTTTTNTATSSNTSVNPNTNTNPTGTLLTDEEIASDSNVKLIDSYIRKQDAVRINGNSSLKSVSLTTLNGSPVYYLIYDVGEGKKIHYWVSEGADNQPQVKAVKITQSVIPTSHNLQIDGRHRLPL